MDQVSTRPVDALGAHGMPTPEQVRADADLPARRLAGPPLNPSVPERVLLRLLSDAPLAVRMLLCRDRILPDAVIDAVIEHPDTHTRSFFARNPHVDPAQRVRLVDDPESRSRLAALLDDEELAHAAATNLALDPDTDPPTGEERRSPVPWRSPQSLEAAGSGPASSASSTASPFALAHSVSMWIGSINVAPSGVSSYSTRGGTST